MEKISDLLPSSPKEKDRKDVYLDKLLLVVNEGRGTKQYPLINYARLQLMLQKVSKSKKNWDRDIWIANILDAKNPTTYFWWIIKK